MSTPPDTLRAFVNEQGITVPRGASALDVVRAWDASAAEALSAGAQRLTDSRGLPVEPTDAAHGGAIYRLLPVRSAAAAPESQP